MEFPLTDPEALDTPVPTVARSEVMATARNHETLAEQWLAAGESKIEDDPERAALEIAAAQAHATIAVSKATRGEGAAVAAAVKKR